MRRFDDDRYYRTGDPELGVVATRGTLAQWRCRGDGPRYVRFGHRVLYLGADLNAWLDARVVDPGARNALPATELPDENPSARGAPTDSVMSRHRDVVVA